MGLHFFLSVLLLSVVKVCVADNITEAASNRVEVKFYRLQVSDWNSGNMETTFHALLAAQANTYCEANLAACGLDVWGSVFKESHIGKVDNSPIDDDKDMLYQFFINYPEGANVSSTSTLKYVLSTNVVKSIVVQLRDNVDYITSLGCDRCYITYINDDFYGIPPSSLENKIIIPLAFLVLIIIIVVALVLHMWTKKREKEKKWQKLNQPKPKKQQPVEDGYEVAEELPKKAELPDSKMKHTENKSRKDKMYSGSAPQNTAYSHSVQKGFDRSGGASNDSGLDADTYTDRTRLGPKPHALEPLDQDLEQETKRKKKKKEKKRSRKSKVDGVENQGYMAGDEGGEMRSEL